MTRNGEWTDKPALVLDAGAYSRDSGGGLEAKAKATPERLNDVSGDSAHQWPLLRGS
eukprot:CAMPEP_0174306348 /NCGR_PEP_ID=MMETSP0810-20121108/391_1 /TAXON_ID=73025 ORGANISM="Eutreptiella gymnastica-like, Strain CCMP1594" /NCGR_SAMPLE_ID=MMETSP0810 /ASSEMBLY_ACC=CAM_ASM_000659 /LENGTH=56 /DNA_ID=CAMNT_0015413033 /DNA_START=1267 /DNA_END=1438 /DNA_ORIENTATION=-